MAGHLSQIKALLQALQALLGLQLRLFRRLPMAILVGHDYVAYVRVSGGHMQSRLQFS